jgi:hypothetical protein
MRTSVKERVEVIRRLQEAGISWEHANTLRRISMTLQRWGELECGDGNDYASWAIERDEQTGKPYMVRYPHDGKPRRTPVADKEKGALKRLQTIMSHYPNYVAYHQTDPRGCVVYVVRKDDIPEGATLDSCYNRGIAVY